MTCMRAWIGSKFGRIPTVTDRVTVGKNDVVFLNIFNRIHFILEGNDDIHKSLSEFEIRRDTTMDYGDGCP